MTIDHNRYPIDHHLVRTLESNRRTILIAGLGLPTRISMAYWATRDAKSTGVFVSPKHMHRYIEDQMSRHMKVNGAPPTINLVTTQWLYRNRPEQANRVAMETAVLGEKLLEYISEVAQTDSMIALRLLSPHIGRDLRLMPFFKTLGFTTISYLADLDAQDITIRMVPG